jgi:LmbE family N-acetylglucosaminyl deacetylase
LLEVTPSTRKKVTREIRRLRPEVLVAPDPSRLWSGREYINHWDHKQAGSLALTAVMPDAPTRVMFQELEREGIEPYEIPNLFLTSNEPDTYIDITDTIDLKLEALAQHVSEEGEAAAPWVRERARTIGEDAGVEYAEAFKTFRFVDDEE